MTTTENRMRIIDTDDLTMESALLNQFSLFEEISSFFDVGDEGPLDGEAMATIVFYSIPSN
jgi:hypothetical protein